MEDTKIFNFTNKNMTQSWKSQVISFFHENHSFSSLQLNYSKLRLNFYNLGTNNTEIFIILYKFHAITDGNETVKGRVG